MALALFDLDRTLIDCNSGRLWVMHEWREGKLSTLEVAKGFYWLLQYSLGQHALDHALTAAVAKLEGESEDEVARRTRAWFEAEVVHRLRPGAQRALDQHRESGDTLVIATTSSPYAGGAAADAYGLTHVISSRFEVEEGRFTGRIEQNCLGDGKARAVQAWADAEGFDLAEASFYTDSVSDRLLLELVGHPVAVNPDRELARLARAQGWAVEDWGSST